MDFKLIICCRSAIFALKIILETAGSVRSEGEWDAVRMLIDGAWVGAASGAVDEIVNPATGVRLDSVPRGGPEDVERAVAAAQLGKKRIVAVPAHERCAILMRVAYAIEREREALARLLAQENWFDAQVQLGIDQIARGEFLEEEEMDARVARMMRA